GSFRDLFETEDAKYKFYSKTAARAGPLVPLPFGAQTAEEKRRDEARARDVAAVGLDVLAREADRILLGRFAPASVLVNADMEVLQFRGDTGHYLTPAPGRATLNLLKMLREGLLVGVRGALLKAKREEAPVREARLRVKSNGGYRAVDVQVVPL